MQNRIQCGCDLHTHHTHLAEDRFVGVGEELGQFLRVTQVQWELVHTQTPGVELLFLDQLVHVHPLDHQRPVALHIQGPAHSACCFGFHLYQCHKSNFQSCVWLWSYGCGGQYPSNTIINIIIHLLQISVFVPRLNPL